MKNVFIVLYAEAKGDEVCRPFIEAVFDSDKKAVRYIMDEWKDKIVSFNPKTREYWRNIDENTIAFYLIEEHEVQ